MRKSKWKAERSLDHDLSNDYIQKIELEFVDSNEFSREEIEEIAELLAQMIFDNMLKAHKTNNFEVCNVE